MYEYFRISAEDLGKDAKIPLVELGDSGEVFYEMALEMVNTIKEHNARGEKTVFICPVGPVGQYPIFVRLVNRDRVSLKNCWFFNMDEYLNDDETYIDFDSPLSFHGFMNRTVYSQIDPELVMPESQRFFPDPKDPGKIDRKIEELGGVDVCFGGIGINGHLAFNEAQDELTAEQFAQLPTIGIKQILGARKLRLGVFRDWHRSVVRQAAYGDVTAHFPASLAQNHPDACIYLNANAAKQPY